eukprot:TRINITY_DN18894_c2_g2_i1.p1 TRINITY_DN18894_c2_g2~~TRINITY_DN18894_c2_g2_i1.p1  ORF type:complete len:227 (-),score=48.60 TRINITY_DN18894_c2_g2_i1:163-843(-)
MLSDTGVEVLFNALVVAGSSIVHMSLSSNNIGDTGAMAIASSLASLPRLTSLELCDNFVQERGSIHLAEAIGGVAAPSHDDDADDPPPMGPLPILSLDLRGNRSRELGAMRWAEVVAAHTMLQFLCLAHNELGRLSVDSFQGLVYAAIASPSLSVLDLRSNFPRGPNQPSDGPPPGDYIEDMISRMPTGEFDAAEVRQGVFIRRHRGSSADKRARSAQQGGSRAGA